MDFKSSIKSVLSKYVRFEGRASRSEYWYWILGLVLTSIVLSIIDGAVLAPLMGFEQFDPKAGQPLRMLLSLVVLLPTLAVAARRLHDIGRSGWWLLVQLIPIIGSLIFLWWMIQRGDEQPNEYGNPPES